MSSQEGGPESASNTAFGGSSAMPVIIGLLAVLALVVVIYYGKCSGRGGHGGVSEGLMKNGWVLYTRPGCGFCDKQKALLGDKFLNSEGNVIDCGLKGSLVPALAHGTAPMLKSHAILQPIQCGDPRIVGYPFWHSQKLGSSKIGLQDAGKLRSMAASRSS